MQCYQSAREGWDWLTSAYCCFVTISTIGFGDVVPGSENFDTTVGQLKMLVAAVYMMFGMALLSMSFNLIQEEMVGKFKWLGIKLGIIKKDDDEDDDDDYGLHSGPQYLYHTELVHSTWNTDVVLNTSTTPRWSTVPRPHRCGTQHLDHTDVVLNTSTTPRWSTVPRPHRGGPQYLDHTEVVHSTSTTPRWSTVPRPHRSGPQYLDHTEVVHSTSTTRMCCKASRLPHSHGCVAKHLDYPDVVHSTSTTPRWSTVYTDVVLNT